MLARIAYILCGAVAAVLATHAIAYFGIRLLPDTASRLAGMLGGSEDVLSSLRAQFQDRPYWDRLLDLLTGKFGTNVDGVPVVSQLAEAVAFSAPRFIIAAGLVALVGRLVLQRSPKRRGIDRWLEFLVQVPPFVWGFVGFICVVSVSDAVDKSFMSLSSFITIVATAATPAVLMALQGRAVMRELDRSDYALFLRSLGFSSSQVASIVRRDAVRKLIPTIEKLVMWLALSLLFAEMLLSMPGIGLAFTAALSRSDVDSLLGIVVLLAILSNLARVMSSIFGDIVMKAGTE